MLGCLDDWRLSFHQYNTICRQSLTVLHSHSWRFRSSDRVEYYQIYQPVNNGENAARADAGMAKMFFRLYLLRSPDNKLGLEKLAFSVYCLVIKGLFRHFKRLFPHFPQRLLDRRHVQGVRDVKIVRSDD